MRCFDPVCMAVEFNNNKFEKRTPEQIDSDSLRKTVYTIESFHVIHQFSDMISDNFAPLCKMASPVNHDRELAY